MTMMVIMRRRRRRRRRIKMWMMRVRMSRCREGPDKR